MKKFKWNDNAPGYKISSKELLKRLAGTRNVETGTMMDVLLEIMEIMEVLEEKSDKNGKQEPSHVGPFRYD